MDNNLIDYVQKFITLTADEAIQFSESFREVKIKKKQFIVQPDFTNKYRSFVVNGAFRSYVVADDGQEHTLQFAIENWWVSDFNSYIYEHHATLLLLLWKTV